MTSKRRSQKHPEMIHSGFSRSRRRALTYAVATLMLAAIVILIVIDCSMVLHGR